MKRSEVFQSQNHRDKLTVLGVVGLGLLLAASAVAQDYRTLSGSNGRQGRATIQTGTVATEDVWNNAGRGFLRWWDPIFETGTDLDNDKFGTTQIPAGTWINPAPTTLANPNISLAGGFIQDTLTEAPYRVAVTSPSTLATATNPAAGATQTFEWQITGLVAGEEYSVEASVPIGPTNIQPDGNAAADYRYQSRFLGFEVVDATGTHPVWIDVFRDGGALVDLGDTVYTADAGGVITVRLYNTVQHDGFGGQVEPVDQPGNDVVYADFVQAIGRPVGDSGSYAASPVVGELLNTPFLGGPIQFNQRVVAARNENTFFGAINRQVSIGSVTSFAYDGTVVDAGAPLRRNMVWSWPAARPIDLSVAAHDQYATDLQAWVTGAPNSAYPRYSVFRQLDNLSSGTSFSGPFVADNAFAHRGPDYLVAPASVVTTGNVTWNSEMPDGDYFVEVHLPNDDAVTDLATQVTYEVLQGATVVSTVTLNQSVLNNWVRLPFQPPTGWTNSAALPLSVRVTDRASAQDVTDGRDIYADAVRFVGNADLSINSTPVIAEATVNDGVTTQARDVVIVARENGKIYCMDAHGNPATGTQPRVYWTWPSEDPATDPNNVVGEDFGIATEPTRFNLSSAIVQNVGGNDMLFIGADNGRVYCLDMTGRGDGTTTRRWTYPDDYNPTAPTLQMTASTLGSIQGSLAFASVGGTPAVIVPASAGRVVALDAAGNAATKTTTELWSYTGVGPALGPITSTPLVSNGNVYVGCQNFTLNTDGEIHAIDQNTGLASWVRTTRGAGGTFGTFQSSPVDLPVALVPGLGANAVAFMDNLAGGNLTVCNAASGAVIWEQIGATSSDVNANLSFAYMRQYDNTGTVFVDANPTILAATVNGQLYGFYADGTLNQTGTHRNWGYFLEGDNQVASFASGGWPNTIVANRSHIYIGDSDGILYAFSSEDDFDAVPPITPGRRPGQRAADGSDTIDDDLNNMIEPDDILLVSRSQYNDLTNKSLSTGITAADITAIKANPVDRRYFEYGESLYIAVVDIPDPTVAPTAGYSVQVTVSGGGNNPASAGQVRAVSGVAVPTDAGIALIKVDLTTNSRLGIVPGPNTVVVRATLGRVRGDEVAMLAAAAAPPLTTGNFNVANPIGIRMQNNSQAGVNVASSDALVATNGALGYTGAIVGSLPTEVFTTGFGAPDLPGQRLSPTTVAEEPVPHGNDAVATMQLYDRSLMFLIQRGGLRNVTVRNSDLDWQPVNNPGAFAADNTDPVYGKSFDPATDLGVIRPLNSGTNKANWVYRNFEDYPVFFPNRSVDYPNLSRGGMYFAKSELGETENLLFNGGVGLTAPTYTAGDRTNYENDPDAYDAGFIKIDQATPVNIRCLVPKYQPANATVGGNRAGYASRQTVYVDSGVSGFSSSKPYRQFVLATNVAEDVRLSTSTTTVDLGSTPTGGGFNGGAAFGPALPWDVASLFKPANPTFNSGTAAQFQHFSVLNDGNTNLLNVRLSKAYSRSNGLSNVTRPLELFMPDQHQLAWLDAGSNMFSDLDPQRSPVQLSGVDNRQILQKSRPGDLAPTRLSTNPNFRSNPTLAVTGGFLLNTATFRPDDPYVGVAPPIGAPSGSYETKIYPFEDEFTGDTVVIPSEGSQATLGPIGIGSAQYEAYADPGVLLKFKVRETRLTNRETTKSAPNVERLLTGTENFAWNNRQPTMLRMDTGDLFTAWSSNRADIGGLPNYVPTLKTEAMMSERNMWRIYVAGLNGTNILGGVGNGQMDELNTWIPSGPNNWFRPNGQIPANGVSPGLFTPLAGYTLDSSRGEASYQFHSPSFPNSGGWDPMTPAGTRASIAATSMAFVGEAKQIAPNGATSDLSQIMMADLGLLNDGSANLNLITPLQADVTSKKSRPSVTRLINGGNQFYQVAYTGYSNGLGELFIVNYSNGVWGTPVSLNVASGFEDLSAPQTVLRRYQNTAVPVVDMFFTGKLRGRQNSEAFMGRLVVDATGQVVTKSPWAVYRNRYEQLRFDAKTGQYEAAGINWSTVGADLDDIRIYVRGQFAGPQYRQLSAGTDTDKIVDRETGELTFTSAIGGKVYVNTNTGTVKLSGVVLPKNADVFIRYTPRLLRVSGATSKVLVQDPDNPATLQTALLGNSIGANYRGMSVQFDDRWIGVFQNGDPGRNLIEDQNYWFQANTNIPAATVDPLLQIRHDRFMMVTNRTSNDGSAATRPFMSSMRMGVELPAPVATDLNGNILNLSVSTFGAPPSGNQVWYQVDPVNGRIYFNSDMEDQDVRVVFTSATQGGTVGPVYDFTITVGAIVEKGEQTVPIEQVGNESDLTLALDPFTNAALNNRRPPLFWMFWTSTRAGVQDVYFQTVAPKTAPQGPGN